MKRSRQFAIGATGLTSVLLLVFAMDHQLVNETIGTILVITLTGFTMIGMHRPRK